MNTRILFVLLMSGLLAACAQAPNPNPLLANCKSQGWWVCKGNPQAPTVNINTKSGKLKASPYCVKTVAGTDIIFRLTPPGTNAAGTVEIIPKDLANTWLAGTNRAPDVDLIKISVPNGLDPTKKYYYGIKAGGQCTDPRVHVER